MVRVLGFHCRDHGFDPQSGNYDPTSCVTWPKNREGGRKEDKKWMTYPPQIRVLKVRKDLGNVWA